MLKAYRDYWRYYSDFKGKSTRSDYWWVVLWNVLINFALGMLTMMVMVAVLLQTVSSSGSYYTEEEMGVRFFEILLSYWPLVLLVFLWRLVNLVPDIALFVRRLRDAGLPWGLVFLKLGDILVVIPVIGWLIYVICSIAILILAVQPSQAVVVSDDEIPW